MRAITLWPQNMDSHFPPLPQWLRKLLLYRDNPVIRPEPAPKTLTLEEVAGLQDYAGRYPYANCGC
jgi:hypothetical protein